jgi:ABC-type Mn2+/Zn2+ transport system ATPase subunit
MAGVDATTERAIIEILRKLRDQNKTVVVVHHEYGRTSPGCLRGTNRSTSERFVHESRRRVGAQDPWSSQAS